MYNPKDHPNKNRLAPPNSRLYHNYVSNNVGWPSFTDWNSSAMADNKNTGYNRTTTGYGANQGMYANQYAPRNGYGQGYGMQNPAADLAAITQGVQGMNLQNQPFATQAKNAALMSTGPGSYAGMSVASNMPYGSQYLLPNGYGASAAHAQNMYASQYMPQFGYPGYQQHDISPQSQHWTPTTGNAGDAPSLITPRRDSISSTGNDQPATPSYVSYSAYGAGGGVAVNRGSPNGVFTNPTTPSPTMMGQFSGQFAKQPERSDISPRIRMLITTEPAIPHAIPAPSSPLKPLDRALENQRGETNVYIRGLLPETTDAMLEGWGVRFGDIKSSKSIIDLNTGLCKGFGFVKYHNYEDAENCIRGFHHLGYEVSFARESFYSKLKTFSDESNTNLYVSNLPKTMNEHELSEFFKPHKVCSSRILRDKNGNARGVGFARFESRDACEEVIKSFNNAPIELNGEELLIQIRYADTQEQKALKQQTQAARQFRSQEYEYATLAWRQGRIPLAGTTLSDNGSVNEFEQYLGNPTGGVPVHGQRYNQSLSRQVPGRSPLGGLPLTTNNSATPLVQINVAAGKENDHHRTTSEATVDGKPTSPATVQATSPVDSANPSEQE